MKRFAWAIFFAWILLASLSLALAEDLPDPRLAGEGDVYDTAECVFEAEWMPKGVRITLLEEGKGLWNIQAKNAESGEILACMQIDGDNDDLVIYYRKASYELPLLNRLSEQMVPEDARMETEIRWAEDIFRTFRGSFDTDFPINIVARMDDGCSLFSFGDVNEAEAVMMIKFSGEPDGIPELMGYVDMNFNWDVCYDGYISLGEAYETACAACREKWSDLPDDHIVLGESGFLLFDTAGYYEEDEEDLPMILTEPLWVIEVQDQRADPSLECYDPSVTFLNYPVLIDPSSGNVIEIRSPEEKGNG
jgi:hypothetical protein